MYVIRSKNNSKTFGYEIWKINQKDRVVLKVLERKVLRRIYSGKEVEGPCRWNRNDELITQYRAVHNWKDKRQLRVWKKREQQSGY